MPEIPSRFSGGSDGSRALYVGGGHEIDKNSGGTITGKMLYYPAGGAMRVQSTPYWVLKDHLGSASVVTDASGITVGEQRYNPYGETRLFTGNMYTDKLFTGQREITNWNVYHYGARFYSPKLGRFLSADTIVPGFANPQKLNRYMYVLGNPLRYTDPTGHVVACNPMEDDCHDPDPAPSPSPSKPKKDKNDPPDPNPTGFGFQLPIPTITQPEPQVPDWGKIALGVGIILAVDLLIVAPIVVGIVLTPGALEATMLLTETGWVLPLVAAVIAVNVYGSNLIAEGAKGK